MTPLDFHVTPNFGAKISADGSVRGWEHIEGRQFDLGDHGREDAVVIRTGLCGNATGLWAAPDPNFGY
jgi:hypothetical protein